MHTTVFRRTAASLVCILLGLIMMSPVVAANGPTALIHTDKAFYFHGDTLETSVSAWNFGEEMKVDVYVALFTWFGTVHILQANGTWDVAVKACIKDLKIPSGYQLDKGPFVFFPALKPAIPEGHYAIGIVLTQAGSLNWICDLNGEFFYIAKPIKKERYVNGTIGLDTNPGTKADPWKTITHALSQVNPSLSDPFLIHVAPGTYANSVNGETFPLKLKPFVYLRGQGAKNTILDAEANALHVILCSKKLMDPGGGGGVYEPLQPFSIVEGFTIMGGKANGLPSTPDGCGGGVYCPDGYAVLLQKNTIEENEAYKGAGVFFTDSSPILHNNIVRKNEASQAGGGILADNSSWAALIGNTVENNKAAFGGGIHCSNSKLEIRNNFLISNVAQDLGGTIIPSGGAIGCDVSSPFIAGNMIKDNTATASAAGSVAHGGGIFCNEGSHPDIRSNAIIGNRANGGVESKGGGIACVKGAAPKLLNSVIHSNSTTGFGGGFYCQYSHNMEVKECTFAFNEAETSGGGIFAQCSSVKFFNNLIYENSALNADGGGICCSGEQDASDILHCTIVGNSASLGKGGGVRAVPTTNATVTTITDCILYGNAAQVGDQLHGKHVVTYSCIEAWTAGGLGNIPDDPKFVKGPFSEFYLATNSPCIDKGSMLVATGSWPAAPNEEQTTDAAGSPDQVGTKVDMGRHYLIP